MWWWHPQSVNNNISYRKYVEYFQNNSKRLLTVNNNVQSNTNNPQVTMGERCCNCCEKYPSCLDEHVHRMWCPWNEILDCKLFCSSNTGKKCYLWNDIWIPAFVENFVSQNGGGLALFMKKSVIWDRNSLCLRTCECEHTSLVVALLQPINDTINTSKYSDHTICTIASRSTASVDATKERYTAYALTTVTANEPATTNMD